jgi:hypothetical protein
MYSSFLVRVWRDEDAEGHAGWQAEVQQIQSGKSWTFSSHEALLAFLQRLTSGDDRESQRRDQTFGP